MKIKYIILTLLIFFVDVAQSYEPISSSNDPSYQILFLVSDSLGTEIHLLNMIDLSRQSITQKVGKYWHPQPLPNSCKILFEFQESNLNSNFREIYLMDIQTRQWKNISNNNVTDGYPTCSSSGSKILFSSRPYGRYEIFLFQLDKNELKMLTDLNAWSGYARFSPDETKIVFVSNIESNDEIYIMDSNGGNQMNLTRNAGNDYEPQFTPCGSKIIFKSDREKKVGKIYIMDIDGQNQMCLTPESSADNPGISYDGKYIVYASYFTKNFEIWVMNIDGDHKRQITKNGMQNKFPKFSPDGKKIIYQAQRYFHSLSDVFIIDSNGNNQTALTKSDDKDEKFPVFLTQNCNIQK